MESSSLSCREGLRVYLAELDKLIEHCRTEDAVAAGLMRQARRTHDLCQERIKSLQKLKDSVESELAQPDPTLPTEDDILW